MLPDKDPQLPLLDLPSLPTEHGVRSGRPFTLQWEAVTTDKTVDVYITGYVTITRSSMEKFHEAVQILSEFEDQSELGKSEAVRRADSRNSNRAGKSTRAQAQYPRKRT